MSKKSFNFWRSRRNAKLVECPLDPFKANYDQVFLEWNAAQETWELPANTPKEFTQAGKLNGQPE